LDIAKSVFQVHGVDSSSAVVIHKRVSRLKLLEFFATLPPCLIGIDACSSAHHWGRELQAPAVFLFVSIMLQCMNAQSGQF
jgi:transposase